MSYRPPYTPEQRRGKVQAQLRVRKRKLAVVRAYKAGQACRDCGETDPVVLELHHRDPGTKNEKLRTRRYGRRVQTTGGDSWVRLSYVEIAEELEKCDVLCANCHRRATHRERQEARERGETAFVRTVDERLSLF